MIAKEPVANGATSVPPSPNSPTSTIHKHSDSIQTECDSKEVCSGTHNPSSEPHSKKPKVAEPTTMVQKARITRFDGTVFDLSLDRYWMEKVHLGLNEAKIEWSVLREEGEPLPATHSENALAATNI